MLGNILHAMYVFIRGHVAKLIYIYFILGHIFNDVFKLDFYLEEIKIKTIPQNPTP